MWTSTCTENNLSYVYEFKETKKEDIIISL
jgi:hypothetical protein